ncbi:DUF2059 domain-containing protein [Roseovarius aestuarii]|nr:DUF2059 domain-containing protein [Roseovarius aestuarii]
MMQGWVGFGAVRAMVLAVALTGSGPFVQGGAQAQVSLIPIESQTQADARDRLQAFLQVTGFDVALDSIALAARDAPMMLGMQAEDFGADWSRMAEEVFAPNVMRGMALDILEKTLSDEVLHHAAEFYGSDLGQQLVAVENASHMVEDDEAKLDEGAGLLDRADQGRRSVLERLVTAIDSNSVGLIAVREVQVRFLMAASAAGILVGGFDEATLRALLAEQDGELRETLKANALRNAAFTYKDISSADLSVYVAALEDPKMQQLYELMNAIQFEVMANRFEVLAGRMANLHPGQAL